VNLRRNELGIVNSDTVRHTFACERDRRKRRTDSATQPWQTVITSRSSSGSSRAAIAVEPTRSQNITVSCARSAKVADISVAAAGSPYSPRQWGQFGEGIAEAQPMAALDTSMSFSS
jgi:hypothetical protein